MARRISTADVITAAELKGVPPELALAIWKQESSSGRNTATSPRGAVGGFQVIRPTFQRMLPGGDINDPVDNMMAGLNYLAEGLRKSGGDPEGAAQYYYHGGILPPGVEGPTSGPGTPTTRQYGKQVVAEMRRRGWKRSEYDDEAPESDNKFSNAKELIRPLYIRPDQDDYNADDYMRRPYITNEDGTGVYDFDSDPEETERNRKKFFGEEDDDDYGGEDVESWPPVDDPSLPPMQIAGLTRPLDMNVNTPGLGGMGDVQMGLMGSQNYELDRYIRKIVDEEFKNG